jgi:hypothetical protein
MKEESVAILMIKMTSTIIKNILISLHIEKMRRTQESKTGARDLERTLDSGNSSIERMKKLSESISSRWRRNKVRLNFQFG